MSRKIPVIVDTDPGTDDILALLLVLASPEVDLLAIIVTHGNTDRESAWKNIFKLYGVLARHFEQCPEDRVRFPNFAPDRKTILARGPEKPLQDDDLTKAANFHGLDGLGEITTRHPELSFEGLSECKTHPQLDISIKSGVDVALELISAEERRSITYIVLGPLTNLALMLQKDPGIVRDRLGLVCCMGGALDVPGNTSPVAEFNFYADPHAVREVLNPVDQQMGFPPERFMLAPLDVTTSHELSFPLYKAKVDKSFESTASPSDPSQKHPLHHFTSSFLERTRETMLEFGKDALELHDPVAAWYAIENPPMKHEHEHTLKAGWKVVRRKFEIECQGETQGMLVVDSRQDQGAYAPRAVARQQLDKFGEEDPQAGEPGGNSEGVLTLVKTPGQDAVVKLLLKRIWGVDEE